jgi:hypothetical protein
LSSQHHNISRQNNLKTEKQNIPDDVYVVHSAITVVWRMRWRSAGEPLISWDHTTTNIHTRKKVPILRHEPCKTLKHKGEKKTFREASGFACCGTLNLCKDVEEFEELARRRRRRRKKWGGSLRRKEREEVREEERE